MWMMLKYLGGMTSLLCGTFLLALVAAGKAGIMVGSIGTLLFMAGVILQLAHLQAADKWRDTAIKYGLDLGWTGIASYCREVYRDMQMVSDMFNRWGTFEEKDEDDYLLAVHIIPCDKAGNMHPGHFMSENCPCGPKIDRPVGAYPAVVIHMKEGQ